MIKGDEINYHLDVIIGQSDVEFSYIIMNHLQKKSRGFTVVVKQIDAKTKWPPFAYWYFQMHFHKKVSDFIQISLKYVTEGLLADKS